MKQLVNDLNGPCQISVHGNFQRMVNAGDVSGKFDLASIPFSASTYGVGALAGLQGEILVWDGTVLITPGESVSGSTQAPRADDQAALLITAQVKEWEGVQVPSDMALTEFERFVTDTTRSRGVDIKKPFPLVLGKDQHCYCRSRDWYLVDTYYPHGYLWMDKMYAPLGW